MAWLLLSVSGVLNVGWLVFLQRSAGFRRVLPLLGNAAFGLSSTYCFSRALEALPMSTAYAVYTGLSVLGAYAFDALALRQPLSMARLVFGTLVIIGAVGLRLTAAAH